MRSVTFSVFCLSLLVLLVAVGSFTPVRLNVAGASEEPSAVSEDLTLDIGFVGELRLGEPAALSLRLESRRDAQAVTVLIRSDSGVDFLPGADTFELSLSAKEPWDGLIPMNVSEPGNHRIAVSATGPHLVGAHRVIYVNALPEGSYVGDVPLPGSWGSSLTPVEVPSGRGYGGPEDTLDGLKGTSEHQMPQGQDEFKFVPQNPGTVVVKGSFVFLNETDVSEPLWWAWVLVWDEDTFSFDDLLWDGLTNTNGEFETPPLDQADEAGTLDIYVELRLENGDTKVMPASGSAPYSGTTSTTANVPDGTFDLGTLRPTGADFEAATRIFHQLDSHGWAFGASLGDDIGGVGARYPSPDGGPHYHPMTSLFYPGEIHIPSGSDWDRAEDVTLHEHGHYVMDWTYTPFNPSPGGEHFLCGDSQDRGLSWSEGWATAWALFALDDPIFTYPSGTNIDYEAATYCPEVDTHHDHSEFRVTAALWDIYDDGMEMYDLFAWGVDEIWTTLKTYDDAHYQDFYGSWVGSGNSGDVFLMTAYQNTIDYDIAPTVQVAQPNAGGWLRGSIQVEATAGDSDNTVRHVDFWYTVDGSSFVYIGRDTAAPFEVTWNASGLNEATIWIRAQSFDGMKTSTFDVSDISFGVDNEPPETSITLVGTSGQAGWLVSAVTVVLTSSDELSGLESLSYRVDGGSWQDYTVPLSVVDDGTHLVEFWGRDVAGNEESARRADVWVDTTQPDITVSVDTPFASWGTTTVSEVAISWSAFEEHSGISHYEMSVDGGAFHDLNTETSTTLSLADGEHTIRMRAFDVAGNFADAEVEFRVDTNIFSPTGPYQGVPLYVIVAVVIAIATILVLWRKRRRGESGSG